LGHFGLLTLKACTEGERVLRFEAIAHHTKQLGSGRTPDKFPQIAIPLRCMVDRLTSMLDCVELGFLPDGILDQLPAPSQLAATPGGRYRSQPTPGSSRARRRARVGRRAGRVQSLSPSSPPRLSR
jgi:hypothetical protein